MTISSSLNAGVSGLAANASRLATISDNIANASTYGYKRMEADFHSLVTASSSGSYSAGGVRPTSRRLISESGSVVSSSNPMDLALRGDGFLPVTNVASLGGTTADIKTKLVTTGSFRPNADGYLTSNAGLVLLGWPADADGNIPNYPKDSFAGLRPIQLDKNEYSGKATTKATISANLPASDTRAGSTGTEQTLSMQYYDNLALPQTLNISFTPTFPSTGVENQWHMVITDTAQSGAVVGDYMLNFDPSQATGGRLLSVTTNSGGTYVPATGSFPVTVAGGAIEMTIGKIGEPGGITQIAESFLPGKTTKNGFPAGSVASVEADEKGNVRAYFDNGQRRVIARIPVISVANPNGLKFHDDQTYSLSRESGQMALWNAGEGPTQGILSYSREESGTDVAGELTDLIQTQRAYSSNAKVIQTVDEMLQETTNMKR